MSNKSSETSTAVVLDKLLLCDICHKEYDTEDHIPRMLPCFHAFCGSCLDTLKSSGSFHCPMCRRSIPATGPFPVDITRVVLLDMKRSTETEGGVTCEGCSDGKRASMRCLDCAEYLCEDCADAHGKVKVSKEHNVIALKDATTPAMFAPGLARCDTHPDKQKELFCYCCRTDVCPLCALINHKACNHVVTMANVIDEKKKEMMSLCGQLEKEEMTFRSKVAESEASVENSEANLGDAERQVEKVFADIVTLALERQGELLEQLRNKAKADRNVLEDQIANFRALMLSAESAADYGKRLVSMNLGKHILGQKPDLMKVHCDLSKMTSCSVKPAPKYKMCLDKYPEVKAAVKRFGQIGSVQGMDTHATPAPPCRSVVIHAQSPLKGQQDMSLACPIFHFDTARCGYGCSVSPDCSTLINQCCPDWSPKQGCEAFSFNGTCCTASLPSQTCYWQAVCRIMPKPRIQEGCTLCELGVGTQEALQSGKAVIAPTEQCAVATYLYAKDGCIVAQTFYKNTEMAHVKLASCPLMGAAEHTLGFLLDHARERFYVVDASSCRILCECPVELECPLWPFANVVQPCDVCGADVRVVFHTGQQVNITQPLARLIHATVCNK